MRNESIIRITIETNNEVEYEHINRYRGQNYMLRALTKEEEDQMLERIIDICGEIERSGKLIPRHVMKKAIQEYKQRRDGDWYDN